MFRKFLSVLRQVTGNVQNFNGELDDMAMDEYIQKIRDLMNSVGDTGDKFKLASDKAQKFLEVLSKIAATPLAPDLPDRGIDQRTGTPVGTATRIGPVAEQLAGTADVAREVGMESGFSKLVQEASKQAGMIKFEELSLPNFDGAAASVKRLMSAVDKLSAGLGSLSKASRGMSLEGQLLAAAQSDLSVLGDTFTHYLTDIASLGSQSKEVTQMITELAKLSAEDRAKFEKQLTEATIKELRRRQQAALDYQAGVRKAEDERTEEQFKTAKELEKKEDDIMQEAIAAAKAQIQGIEQTARGIASTVVGFGRQLIADLMDDQMTAEQAFRNLFNSIIELTLTTLAETVIAEGIKAAMIGASASAQQSAALLEQVAAAKTAKIVIANEALKQKAKLATAAIGGGAGGAGGLGASAGIGLGGALSLMGILGVGAFFAGRAIADKINKDRESAKKFSRGGLVTGGTPGRDSVLSMLMPGEFVLPRDLVSDIRAGKPPSTPGKYANGGFVSSMGGIPFGMMLPAASVVFAPQIQTISLPTSVENQRYYRDTVAKTRNKLSKSRGR